MITITVTITVPVHLTLFARRPLFSILCVVRLPDGDKTTPLGSSPPQPFVLPGGQITHGLGPVVRVKIFLFSLPPNQRYNLAVSSLNEGRWPSSRTLG
jgi:hypothetical protein